MRQHQFTETIKTAIGEKYPFDQAANLYLEKFDTSETNIEEIIKQKEQSEGDHDEEEAKKAEKGKEKEVKEKDAKEEADDGDEGEEKKKKKKQNKPNQPNNQKGGEKQKKDKKNNAAKTAKGFKLREIVFKIVPSLHNPVIDHIITVSGFNPSQKVGLADAPTIKICADKCKELIADFQKTLHKGYLIISDKKEVKHRPQPKQDKQGDKAENTEVEQKEEKKEESKEEEKEKYFDFSPLYLTCHEGKRFLEINSFNQSIDKYFQVMASKIQEEQNDVESIAWKKYENIKNDQLNRISKLKNEQEEYVVKAELIEMNIQYVDAIINIIKTLKQSGESWDKITKMINEGKKNGDPMANLIHSLDFENNEVSVYLGDPSDDLEDLTVVPVDILYSAHQNARNYYENKKKNIIKEKKTIDASKIALKQAEKTALKEIENLKLKNNVVNTRKQYWFEKFYWFISSENYLVISGRDMQQNEIIVKKYMKKGDIYMHADFHGAASTVIKNPHKDIPISQQTIEEAAVATICRSKAWEAKIIASAWWVYDHQVSKRAETGQHFNLLESEYLPSGSFMIRGKKNFIYPARMEMGCTLLYKMDDEFVEKHQNDRKRKDKDDNTTVVSGVQMDNQNDMDDMEIEFKNDKQTSQVVREGDPFQPQQQSHTQIESVPIMLQKPSSVIDDEVTIVKLNNPQMPKPKNAQQIQREIQQAKQKNKQQQQQQKEQQEKDKASGKTQVDNKKEKDKKKKGDNKKNDTSESDNEDDKQNNSNKPLPRGKKNKIKKMQEKYGEQDEEERQIRMQMIGAKQMKDVKIKEDKAFTKNEKDNKSQNEKANKQKNSHDDNEELEIPCGSNVDVQTSKLSLEVEVGEKDISMNQIPDKMTQQNIQTSDVKISEPNTVDQQEQNNQEKDKEEVENDGEEDKDNDEDDEIAEAKAREHIKIDEDEKDEVIDSELQEISRLATFTYPEETFSATMLMCAPYTTISILNSKYKIKLVPGTLKKGKTAKQIVHFFQSSKDVSNQEKKCLRNMTDQEIINCIIGNVKLAGAEQILIHYNINKGLQKIKDKEKQAKKQARKVKDAASEKK